MRIYFLPRLVLLFFSSPGLLNPLVTFCLFCFYLGGDDEMKRTRKGGERLREGGGKAEKLNS